MFFGKYIVKVLLRISTWNISENGTTNSAVRPRSWILAQPQIRWNPDDRISLGIEYQLWMNKLGDGATDENVIQALLVWKF